MPSTLNDKLNSIISEASNSTLEKVAQIKDETPVSLTDEDAKGLVKLASVLRNIDVEPSYPDLYNFIGGLYDNR